MKTSLGGEVFCVCLFVYGVVWFVCFSLFIFNLLLMLYLLPQLKKVRLGQSNILKVKASSLDFNPVSTLW